MKMKCQLCCTQSNSLDDFYKHLNECVYRNKIGGRVNTRSKPNIDDEEVDSREQKPNVSVSNSQPSEMEENRIKSLKNDDQQTEEKMNSESVLPTEDKSDHPTLDQQKTVWPTTDKSNQLELITYDLYKSDIMGGAGLMLKFTCKDKLSDDLAYLFKSCKERIKDNILDQLKSTGACKVIIDLVCMFRKNEPLFEIEFTKHLFLF